MTPLHELARALEAEQTIYDMADDPALQEASWCRLHALQLQMDDAVRQARATGTRAFRPTADLLALRERAEISRLRGRRLLGGGVV